MQTVIVKVSSVMFCVLMTLYFAFFALLTSSSLVHPKCGAFDGLNLRSMFTLSPIFQFLSTIIYFVLVIECSFIPSIIVTLSLVKQLNLETIDIL